VKVGNEQLNPDWVEMLMGYPTGWTDHGVPIPDGWWLDGHVFPVGRDVPQPDYEAPHTTSRRDLRRPRLHALGNSVVPELIKPIAESILDYLEQKD